MLNDCVTDMLILRFLVAYQVMIRVKKGGSMEPSKPPQILPCIVFQS